MEALERESLEVERLWWVWLRSGGCACWIRGLGRVIAGVLWHQLWYLSFSELPIPTVEAGSHVLAPALALYLPFVLALALALYLPSVLRLWLTLVL